MNKKFELYYFQLPFKNPQWIKKSYFHLREGLLLKDCSRCHMVEMSPLPNFSKESLIDLKNEIIDHIELFEKEELDTFKLLLKKKHSFSFLFGLYSHLLKKEKRNSPGYKTRAYIDIPSIEPHYEKKILEQLFLHDEKKEGTIKLKLSSYNLTQIKSILKAIPEGFKKKLHLDFNQKFDLSSCEDLFLASNPRSFFLIEEPLKNGRDLFLLEERFEFSLALDESLREKNFQKYLSLNNLKSIEIKPQLDFHLLFHEAITELFEKKTLLIQLSSAYESPIGLEQIGMIGTHFFKNPTFGIDTASLFKGGFPKSCSEKKGDLLFFQSVMLESKRMVKLW